MEDQGLVEGGISRDYFDGISLTGPGIERRGLWVAFSDNFDNFLFFSMYVL